MGAGLLLISGQTAMAQMNNVKSAEFAIDASKPVVSPEDILEAKNYIDEAYKDEKTSNNNRMWLVRGMVYSRLYNSSGNELLSGVSANSGYISGYSMMQFYKSVEKKKPTDIETSNVECAASFGAIFNESGTLFNTKEYDKLVDYYRIILFLYDEMAKVDTATINALERQKVTRKVIVETLASVAAASTDAKLKKEVLQQLIDGGSKSPAVFEALSRVYLEDKDTAGAERIIRQGLERAPGDNNMFQVLVNFFVVTNNVKKLMSDVNKQIEASPDTRLYYTRAYLQEMDGKFEEAMADYRSAIAMDEFNYDANFNLGLALMKYESKKIYDKMGTAKSAEMKQLKADLTKVFTDARGFLERASENTAYSIDDQVNIFKALRSCAQELGDEAGAKVYQEKIDALNVAR